MRAANKTPGLRESLLLHPWNHADRAGAEVAGERKLKPVMRSGIGHSCDQDLAVALERDGVCEVPQAVKLSLSFSAAAKASIKAPVRVVARNGKSVVVLPAVAGGDDLPVGPDYKGRDRVVPADPRPHRSSFPEAAIELPLLVVAREREMSEGRRGDARQSPRHDLAVPLNGERERSAVFADLRHDPAVDAEAWVRTAIRQEASEGEAVVGGAWPRYHDLSVRLKTQRGDARL